MKSLRIAFLTPEFATENTKNGGLADYVYRMSKTLKNMGHEPEVFTLSNRKQSPVQFEGIRVERVNPYRSIYLRLILRVARICNIQTTYKHLLIALAMARAVSKREKDGSFDFVHSSDCCVPGLFLRKCYKRPLIVRCSWNRDLCMRIDGVPDVFDIRLTSRLEQKIIQRANVAYAPSKAVANYLSEKYRLKVGTLLPPFLLNTETSSDLPRELPKKFLIHFGVLGPIKGTDTLAEALPLIWREEPTFTMVWAGGFKKGLKPCPSLFSEYMSLWDKRASQVIWLGDIERPLLYGVLKLAKASVLPSHSDNIPNTAIESLSLGIPIIATKGASIDELIEPGFSGELVPIGDPVALAKSMLRVWRNEVPWIGTGFRQPSIMKEMRPHTAALNLIRLAGF